MIVIYLRSSSIGTYDMCPFQYFLQYELGIESAPNPRTMLGTMAHKALELLARRKLAEQNGEKHFEEEELGVTMETESVTPDIACSLAFEYYANRPGGPPNHVWCEEDFLIVQKHVKAAMTHSDGAYNPLNRKVLAPEQYFDIEIREDWAKIDKLDPTTNEKLSGFLRIKGTVDLITEASPNTLECLDWKTGSRRNWAKNTTKSHSDLMEDKQMLLYFYALCKLYPQYRHVYLTIFFTKDGGPFLLHFDKETDLARAEEVVKESFLTMSADESPKRVMDTKDRWRICQGFCYYGKTPALRAGSGSICNSISNEVKSIGLDKVRIKHGAKAHLGYSDGGGRTAREKA